MLAGGCCDENIPFRQLVRSCCPGRGDEPAAHDAFIRARNNRQTHAPPATRRVSAAGDARLGKQGGIREGERAVN